MLKFLFELLTDPLSLPINPLYEYIILGIIGIIAFKIAWEISPGGKMGSLIHWSVRLIVFAILWAVLNFVKVKKVSEELKNEMNGIKHHLIDVAEPEDTFNVVDYCNLAIKTINDFKNR